MEKGEEIDQFKLLEEKIDALIKFINLLKKDELKPSKGPDVAPHFGTGPNWNE